MRDWIIESKDSYITGNYEKRIEMRVGLSIKRFLHHWQLRKENYSCVDAYSESRFFIASEGIFDFEFNIMLL